MRMSRNQFWFLLILRQKSTFTETKIPQPQTCYIAFQDGIWMMIAISIFFIKHTWCFKISTDNLNLIVMSVCIEWYKFPLFEIDNCTPYAILILGIGNKHNNRPNARKVFREQSVMSVMNKWFIVIHNWILFVLFLPDLYKDLIQFTFHKHSLLLCNKFTCLSVLESKKIA